MAVYGGLGKHGMVRIRMHVKGLPEVDGSVST